MLLEGLLFPESPRWHNDKLWFSDMDSHRIMTADLNGNSETIVEIPNRPSGLGWLPDGRLLIVSMENCRLLRLDPDGIKEHSDISNLATFNCNDMVVDKKGRAYVGNFGFDYFNTKPFKPSEIVLVSSEGEARIVADDMAFSNGIVITPDDKTLIVAETFAARLTAFRISEDGSLSDRRIWANLKSIAPDGICLDEENGIWVAAPGRHRVVRVNEKGKITDKVKIATDAYACMLGGADRDILFITTSTHERINGKIEYVKVEIPGIGLP
ncbi:MAG: SMP-30/gluconolactonase/LRE family protein [Candidatus Thorarchaeota archaeon]